MRTEHLGWALCAVLCTPVAIALANVPAGDAGATGASYPLDPIARTLEAGEKLPCERDAIETVAYRGSYLRYHKAVRVHPAFVPRLRAFEQVVARIAREHYGREPRVVRHLGTYNCRRMRRYPDWVSEHALANAIDIAGFDFGPMSRGAQAPEGLPRALTRAFRVRVLDHWNGRSKLAVRHAAFLRALADELIARRDIFSVLLGPGWPGHANHFHFDRAPYRVVEGFETERD